MNMTGSENGTETGIKHGVRVDSDLDMRVGISDGNNKAEVTSNRELVVSDVQGLAASADILAALNGTLDVSDTAAQTILDSILDQLANGILEVDDNETQTLLTSILSQLGSGSLTIGTEDGTPTGTQHVFVNNMKSMILATADRRKETIYLDKTSRKNRRVDYFKWTSSVFPGIELRRNFIYELVGSEYVNVDENYQII